MLTRMRSKHARAAARLRHDLYIILGSFLAALILLHIGLLGNMISFVQNMQLIGACIAGFFFVSAFTVAFATIAIGAIALTLPPLQIALWGAVGAALGDILIFTFIRDRVATDLKGAIKKRDYRAALSFFHTGLMHWLAPILGAICIATPVPDEIGLALMGLSRMRTIYLIPIAFVMNFMGIWAIATITRAL